MKKIFILFVSCFLSVVPCVISQSIGIGTTTPNASSLIDITSINKGLLIPRMTTSGISSISTPAKGLMVYDSIKNQLMVNMGSNIIPNWQTIVFNSGWSLNGNSGVNAATGFIGTIDSVPLNIKAYNQKAGLIDITSNGSTFFGYQAGNVNTGNSNTGIGRQSLYSNTSGIRNSGIGYCSGYSNTTGYSNTAVGFQALFSNTTGIHNTATGDACLYTNVSGNENTANGNFALFNNVSGNENTAIGFESLLYNTEGNGNTAIGFDALFVNQTGNYNTAVGMFALHNNLTGNLNVANGYRALYSNSSGIENTANGSYALSSNNNSFNTGIGNYALEATTNAQYNVAVGYVAGNSYGNGYNNVFVGANTDVNASGLFNVIAMGQATVVTSGSSTARFGNAATVSYGGWAGWTNVSDGCYKKNVRENVPGIEFINKLRPVTYNLDATSLDVFLHKNDKDQMSEAAKAMYAKALDDKAKIVYTGFVAQEVEAAAKQLGFDFSGVDAPTNENDTYGLRYAEFVVPLVKAVQELSKQNDGLKRQNEGLLNRIEKLESMIAGKK